jgi:predicted DNA-binding transcriptional regulator AlpA
MKKIIGPTETMKVTNLSRSTLWRLERKGKFPQRINISSNRVGWYEDEVGDWIESRPRGLCQREGLR